MDIIIYGSRRQEEHSEQIRRLILNLVMGGSEVSIHEKLFDYLTIEKGLSLSGVRRVFQCPSKADMALSIGGDGTLLRTVAWIGPHQIPVLGLNTGHLGYLTAMTLEESLTQIDNILQMNFRRDVHTMLQVDIPGTDKAEFALNEIVVGKEDSASMITTTTLLNGNLLADYKADGLIVSTPTGSTAYNLSVGGPIVQPSAPVWVISPIAAHSLTLRPLVVSHDSDVELCVNGRGSKFRLAVDGRAHSLPLGTNLKLRRSERVAVILQQKNRDFARIIGSKLLFNG